MATSYNNIQNGDGHVGSTNISSDDTNHPYRPIKDCIIDMFKTMVPIVTSNCCIYRVPKSLRVMNEAAYTPRVISIGPYHHKKEELQFMENHKVRYLHRFLENCGVDFDTLIANIKDWEGGIRQCYAESFQHMSSDDYVKMVLMDGAFVSRYILESEDVTLRDEDDKFLYTDKVKNDITYDLTLLENQLPFYVLKSLHDLAFSPGSPDFFLKVSCDFFSDFNKQDKQLPPLLEVLHFTDLLRTFYLPTNLEPIPSAITVMPLTNLLAMLNPLWTLFVYLLRVVARLVVEYHFIISHLFGVPRQESFLSHRRWVPRLETFLTRHLPRVLRMFKFICNIPMELSALILQLFYIPESKKLFSYSAKNLYNAGFRFEASSSRCLFDISFKEKTEFQKFFYLDPIPPNIHVPCFTMTGDLESLFRNLVALEQYQYQDKTFVSDYITLLDSLINTSTDVQLLAEEYIIVGWSDDYAALATLINNLGKGIVHSEDKSYFRNINEDLVKYYRERHRLVIFWRTLGKIPWGMISVGIAITFFVFTVIKSFA